jgi:ParB family chromosome partitioning protein
MSGKGKRPSLGKGLGDLGLSELLGDLDSPAVSVAEKPVVTAVAEAVPATKEAIVASDEQPVVETPSEVSASDKIATTPATQEAPVAAESKAVEQPATVTQAPPVAADNKAGINAQLKSLPVDVLKPGRYQPRKTFDEDALEELANSIKSQGIIQPIVVRPMNEGFEIIAGERRWRAAQRAELAEVPVIVKDLTDEAALAMSLIENIQRRDLNVIEEAEALDRLIREFRLTHQEVAQAVGKSRTGVTNLLRLLKLNIDVRLLVENGDIEMGHARALLSLEGLEQSKVAQAIVKKGLSVRQTEVLIRRVHDVKAAHRGEAEKPDPDVLRLQNELAEKLGANVRIQHTAKGKGRLVINYNSLEELQGILEHVDCVEEAEMAS